MKIIYATDLHGNRRAFETLFAEAERRSCRAIVLGGDLLPKRGFIRDPLVEQGEWVEAFLRPLARHFRDENPHISILWLLGNDDWRVHEDLLLRMDGEDVASYLHGRAVTAGGVAFAGLAYVPITPFGIKDWERFDTPDQEVPVQLSQSIMSRPGPELARIDLEKDLRALPTLEEELNALAAACNPAETVFVFHAPPSGGMLDMTSRREPVGSRAIRRFIEAHAPPLTLHGHIHESPRMSGAILERIGPTLAVNPGGSEHRLSAIVLDTDDPETTLERVGDTPR
jgi:Icc-related predicted phosphoesterase